MSQEGTFSEKVRSGVIWSLVQNWGMRFGGLLVFTLLARVLSPSELGIFAAATTVIAFCGLFVESGLSEAVVQRATVNKTQLNTVFLLNLGLALLAVCVIWVSAPAISRGMNIEGLDMILRVGSLSIIIGAVGFVQSAMHRRAFDYRYLATVTLLATVIAGLVAVAMAVYGGGAWSLVVQSLLFATVMTALLWWRPKWMPGRGFDLAGVKGLVSYGGQRLLATLLDFANTRVIEIFFAATLGPAALGLYVAGARIYQALMQILSSAVLDIAHNAFSRLASDPVRLREAYYRSISISAAVAVPAFVVPAAVSSEIVEVVFGAKWVGVGDVLAPLLLLGAIQVLQFYNGVLYNAIGRPGVSLKFMIGKTIITLSVLFFSRDFPLPIVVNVFVWSQVLIAPVSFYVAKRVINISFERVAQAAWVFIMASALAYVAIESAKSIPLTSVGPLVRLLFLLSIGAVVYFSTLVVVGRRDLRNVVEVFRGRSE